MSQINLVSQLEEIHDLEVLYTDFTEIIYQRGKARVQLMPIVDHQSKLVVGHALGPSANTELALEAWGESEADIKEVGPELGTNDHPS